MTLEQEIETARKKYGAFHSTHEIHSVLLEEVQEYFDEVKSNKKYAFAYPEHQKEFDIERVKRMCNELTQIAAIALRAVKELENNEVKFV